MGKFKESGTKTHGEFRAGNGSTQTPSDARFAQVVGRHLHFDAVADGEADEAFAHFAANGGEDEVLVVQHDAEHGSGEDHLDAAFDFDMFFFHGLRTTETDDN
jgi:hypothetical protein